MKPGLYLVQIPITYYRAILIVGWMRRLEGDEYEMMPGCRVVVRVRGEARWNGIAQIAEKGPGDRYRCEEPMQTPELLHRLTMRRRKPCIEAAWAEHCPRPAGWVDAE